MLTFEDLTGYFLKAATSAALSTHPEYWINSRTLEREFACTCHTGSCEEAEKRSNCTISFSWSTLDTALSLEGPSGVCDFFHEPDEHCPHLHTREIPPLVIDLSYSLLLKGTGASISEAALLSLTQMLKLHASEHSSRAIETRPGISFVLNENRLQPESLTLQQRVELPIWHPDGMYGLHDDPLDRSERVIRRHLHETSDEEDEEHEEEELLRMGLAADNPRPEEWLPQVIVEVCQDVLQVLNALDAVRSHGALNRDG